MLLARRGERRPIRRQLQQILRPERLRQHLPEPRRRGLRPSPPRPPPFPDPCGGMDGWAGNAANRPASPGLRDGAGVKCSFAARSKEASCSGCMTFSRSHHGLRIVHGIAPYLGLPRRMFRIAGKGHEQLQQPVHILPIRIPRTPRRGRASMAPLWASTSPKSCIKRPKYGSPLKSCR